MTEDKLLEIQTLFQKLVNSLEQDRDAMINNQEGDTKGTMVLTPPTIPSWEELARGSPFPSPSPTMGPL